MCQGRNHPEGPPGEAYIKSENNRAPLQMYCAYGVFRGLQDHSLTLQQAEWC